MRTVGYKVSDIQKAKEWYSKILGISPYFDEPFYVGFEVAGYELGLMPIENESEGKTEGVCTYWGVDDVQQSYNELIANGATEYEPPQNVGGDIVTAMVKDPWGNLFGIICNPYFKLPDTN